MSIDTRVFYSPPETKSVRVSGQVTSVSLERCFWDALVDACKEEGVNVGVIIKRISEDRLKFPLDGEYTGLSSAIRQWLFKRAEIKARHPQPEVLKINITRPAGTLKQVF